MTACLYLHLRSKQDNGFTRPLHLASATGLLTWSCISCVQYIGGVDPRNVPGNTSGFVNEACLVKPNKTKIEWRQDSKQLWTPYVNELPMVNLHIHSKNLKRWRSDRPAARHHRSRNRKRVSAL